MLFLSLYLTKKLQMTVGFFFKLLKQLIDADKIKKGDFLMVDKGLSIQEEIEHLGLVLHISLFAPGNGRISVKEIFFSPKDCLTSRACRTCYFKSKKKVKIVDD